MINKYLSIISFFTILISLANADPTIYSISEIVSADPNYNKADFKVEPGTEKFYFEYSFTQIPTSRIGAFRFIYHSFDKAPLTNEVFCTFVDPSTSTTQMVNALDSLTNETSACIGSFKEEDGIFDGIVEYDMAKTKLLILLKITGDLSADASIYIRNKENILTANEQIIYEDSIYSLIPYTIIISNFRSNASKILFYSKARDMQMYYVEENSPYPEKLFSGNIMLVHTNPEMVRQKYKNANTMILLTKPLNMRDVKEEQFQFQVLLFASDYLLDFYMGSNPEGREKNSPLAINVTECSEPYYAIFNYNKPESKVISLYIDQIYGKIKSLSVAPTFSGSTWEDMLKDDLKEIDINTRKYDLPKNSATHLDVYKVECTVPSLFNFYFVDETAKIPELDYGIVAITTLKANKIVSFPFISDIQIPKLTIEVFNPTSTPFVIINDGFNEYIVNKNSLVQATLMNTNHDLVVKERGGNANTRIIIKVGYNILRWEQKSQYVSYNEELNMYVFNFPIDVRNYYRSYALLKTSGTNEDNNVKYCYGTNIGSPILPSSENCYRVSKDNSYTIKIMNPAVMYKDYDLDETFTYYVSMKPTNKQDKFDIDVTLVEYEA